MSTAHSAVPIETLLSNRKWVRGMARALVFGDHDADDLEQDAWLASLEGPPRENTSPRGWLATVMRRTAAKVGRRDLRRREIVAERAPQAAAPSALDVVAQAELHERVVRTALGLDEPYRQTILLRFFEDLSIREIAQRVDAPVETIRSRLRRALELLRAEYETRDGAGWRVALLPLAAAPAAKAGALIAGGLLLATIAAVAVVVWPRADDTTDPRGRSAEERSGSGTEAPARRSGTPRISPKPFSEIEDAPGAETRVTSKPAVGRLELQILDSNGKPAAGRKFDLFVHLGVKTEREILDEPVILSYAYGNSEDSINWPEGLTMVEAASDANGIVRRDVEAGAPGRFRLCVTPADWRGQKLHEQIDFLAMLPFEPVTEGATKRLPPITLPAVPLLVAGRVENQAGEPVVDILVHALLVGADAENADLVDKEAHRLVTRTDAAGRFRIESSIRSTDFLAWAHSFGDGPSARLTPFKTGEANLVLRIAETGGVQGRVRSASGEQPSIALRPEGIPEFHVPYSWHSSLPADLEVGPTGDFRSEGIATGTYTLEVSVGIALVRSIPGVVIEAGKMNADPRFADLLVGEELKPCLVTVVDEAGNPIPGARVFLRSTTRDGPVKASMTWHTNELGEYSILLPEGVPMTVMVDHEGYLPWEQSGVKFPLRVTLERGADVVIHVLDAASLPRVDGVYRYWVCLIPESEVEAAVREKRRPIPKQLPRSQVTDESRSDGGLVFQGTRPDRYAVLLFPDRSVVNTGSGTHQDLSGGEGLELGRIDVRRGQKNEATYRVEPARVLDFLGR